MKATVGCSWNASGCRDLSEVTTVWEEGGGRGHALSQGSWVMDPLEKPSWIGSQKVVDSDWLIAWQLLQSSSLSCLW